MNKTLKVVLTIFVCFVLVAGGAFFSLNRGLNEASELVINNIDLKLHEDGLYRGLYVAGRFTNEIEVEIRNNEITRLNILQDVRFSRQEVIDELFDNVIKKQSLDVDIVSGATVTGKAYLKAIENALAQ